MKLAHPHRNLPAAMRSWSSVEWETPTGLFASLNSEFNFELDPCCTVENNKCVRFYTAKENGLSESWGNYRVYMNPPYGRRIGHWMHKARVSAEAGALVVCLVPARTDTAWWHEEVIGYASELRWIRGRIGFGREDGKRSRAPFPSVVVVYNPGAAPQQTRCESIKAGL